MRTGGGVRRVASWAALEGVWEESEWLHLSAEGVEERAASRKVFGVDGGCLLSRNTPLYVHTRSSAGGGLRWRAIARAVRVRGDTLKKLSADVQTTAPWPDATRFSDLDHTLCCSQLRRPETADHRVRVFAKWRAPVGSVTRSSIRRCAAANASRSGTATGVARGSTGAATRPSVRC